MKNLFKILFLLISYQVSGNEFSIIITEIMADPTPSRGLPEREFIELYNNSGNSVNLKGYVLKYGTFSVTLGSMEIRPGEYIILCRDNNVSFFEPYGKVLGLERFSLLNEGSLLQLISSSGQLLHEVNYSSDWYEKGRDQGYSLEMIDILAACKQEGNWTSSSDASGGTPGGPNASAAEVSDTEAPRLSNFSSDDYRIFSIVLTEEPLLQQDFLSVKGEVELAGYSVSGRVITLELVTALKEGESFSVILTGLSDCIGNSLQEPLEFVISNIRDASPGEVVLSEILFNPRGTGKDFVEIANISDNVLSLRNVKLARRNASGEIESVRALTSANLEIFPGQVICFTEDKESLLYIYPMGVADNIVQIPSLPSYTNEGGTVVLLGKDSVIFETFSYMESQHYWSVDDPDGISLERINLTAEADRADNWRSVSSLYGFASPGFRPAMEGDNDNFLKVDPVVFNPAAKGGLEQSTTIEIGSKDAGNLSVWVFDVNGTPVHQLISNQYISGNSRIQWSGNDTSGKLMPVGYYLVYAELTTSEDTRRGMVKVLLVP